MARSSNYKNLQKQKTMLQLEEVGKVLSAESKPYSFDGNEGVSHKVRVLLKDEIMPLRANADLVNQALTMVGKEAKISLSLTFPKENIRLNLISLATK